MYFFQLYIIIGVEVNIVSYNNIGAVFNLVVIYHIINRFAEGFSHWPRGKYRRYGYTKYNRRKVFYHHCLM